MTSAAPRRLAVVGLSHPFRGGISHYTTLLVRELRKRHDVAFVTLKRQYPRLLFPGSSQYDASERKLAEPNERLIDSLNPWTWLRAARALERRDPELIVVQWWHPFFAPAFGTLVRLLPARLRRRVCFLCHNVLPHEATPLTRLLTRYAFAPVPFFIVHSQQDERALLALKPDARVAKGRHPSYAEFGTWGDGDKAGSRAALGIPADQRTLLFFGLVRRYKGLEYLIEAMGRVLERLDCLLLVVGEFYDDKRRYVELAEGLGLGDKLRVVDRYVPNEEVAAYFRCADAVVLPYVSATQSGIVQIAFGLGCPVITTRVGGLPEAVEDGRTGLVVAPCDAAALAEAIVRYYEDDLEPAFREQIARRSDRFEWSAQIELIEGHLAQAGG